MEFYKYTFISATQRKYYNGYTITGTAWSAVKWKILEYWRKNKIHFLDYSLYITYVYKKRKAYE